MATLYQEVRAALREADFTPRKRLGQNFLVHERVIDAMLRLLDLSEEDQVVEIGPGLGFLTRHLVDRAAQVWAIEVDAFLADSLERSALGVHPGFHLIRGDILKVPLEKVLPAGKIKLVANLPYSISTPVLFRLFDRRKHFSSMVLMVQKEVADRMISGPGSKAYGTLSVWCQVHGRVTDKISVSPEAFYPKPKVRSTAMKLELWPEPLVPAEEMASLRGLVRCAFGQRRKTLANALAGWLAVNRGELERLLRAEGIDPQRRGETLAVDEFIGLARAASARSLAISTN